jgi:hypothetical protein
MPEERVDEGALSGIELADHHEQEQLVEPTHDDASAALSAGATPKSVSASDGGQQLARLGQLIGERRLKNVARE